MKKILLVLTMISGFLSNAQFFENFNASDAANFPPNGWLVAYNNVGTNNWQSTAGTAFAAGIDGSPAAMIAPQNIGMGNTSADWLITPQIAVGADFNLFFMARAAINGFQNTYFQVLVTTSSQDDLDSYELIANYTDDELNAFGTANPPNLVGLSLAQFEGQQVHIAFRRTLTQSALAQTGDRIILDDVIVSDEPQLPIFILQGHVRFDISGSCTNGTAWPFAKIQAVSDIETKTFYTDQTGFYSNYIRGNNASVSVIGFNDQAFEITPATHAFTYGQADPVSVGDFCMSQNDPVQDVAVAMTASYQTVPGELNQLSIRFSNNGSAPSNGTVQMNFADPQYEFLAYSANPTSETATSKSWDFSDLQPMETREITVFIENNVPTDVPSLNLGDIITFNASINIPAADFNLGDNQSTLQQTAVSSFDPNDKLVLEGPQIPISQASDYLHYLVRFQNTGTAEARNVEIRDFLDPDFDLSTLSVVSASHNMRTTLLGSLATFHFENIMLPAEQDDEAGSHGYVLYKIKPSEGFGLNESVSNTANIYFDFNTPITTNTVVTQVTDLSAEDFGRSKVALSPNPANGNFSVVSDSDIEQVSIYSVAGRLIRQERPRSGNVTFVDTVNLASGTYIVKIQSAKGQSVKKLIVR